MYLSSATQSLEMVLDAAVSSTNPQYIISYNDMTATGMTLPQSSTQGNLNGLTPVTVLSAPTASTNRQVYNLTLYNADIREISITIRKDISGTKYEILKSTLSPGDTLQWSRESGWKVLAGTNSGGSTISREYTSDTTWTKPAGLRAAMIICVGGGGGGGSGRLDIAGTFRGGGGGGGGGMCTRLFALADDLPSSAPIVIGTGGAGGAGVTVSGSNGNSGQKGKATLFGGLLFAEGGSGGAAGTITTSGGGSGGISAYSSFSCHLFSLPAANGGGGGSAGSAGSNGMGGQTGCPSGGGGGGITAGNISATASVAGGGIYNNGSLVAGPASGTNGANNVCVYLYHSTTISSTIGIGTGGAGSNATNVNGTNGGYGAGGGGGFGQLNTVGISGAGGNGGNGFCLVLEIY